jgi:hypothetical protein
MSIRFPPKRDKSRKRSTLKERELVYEEIHDVGRVVKETETIVQVSL